MHLSYLLLKGQLLALGLPLNFKPLVFELHVVQVLDRLFCSSGVYVLEKAVPFVMLEVVWIFVEHELLQEPERLAELFHF